MSKLILIDALSLEILLIQLGFSKVRQKGSHAFYRHPDGRTTTVPFHVGKDLPRPLLHEVLREISLGIDDYNKGNTRGRFSCVPVCSCACDYDAPSFAAHVFNICRRT